MKNILLLHLILMQLFRLWDGFAAFDFSNMIKADQSLFLTFLSLFSNTWMDRHPGFLWLIWWLFGMFMGQLCSVSRAFWPNPLTSFVTVIRSLLQRNLCQGLMAVSAKSCQKNSAGFLPLSPLRRASVPLYAEGCLSVTSLLACSPAQPAVCCKKCDR